MCKQLVAIHIQDGWMGPTNRNFTQETTKLFNLVMSLTNAKCMKYSNLSYVFIYES